MASSKDYYEVLEVAQNATQEHIHRSYERLAIHRPDQNPEDASEASQLLQSAYDTLKDASKRRIYDNELQFFQRPTRSRTPKPTTESAKHSSTIANSKQDNIDDAESIAQIKKIKSARASQWQDIKFKHNCEIFDLKREIRPLKKLLEDIIAMQKAEQAEEEFANSCIGWIWSLFYKKVEDTEEEKERKANERVQILRIRRLTEDKSRQREAELKVIEDVLLQKQYDFISQNMVDDCRESAIEERNSQRKAEEQEEKERVERVARERIECEAHRKCERERLRKEKADAVWRAARKAEEDAIRHEFERNEKVRQERELLEWLELQATQERRRQQAEEDARMQRQEELRLWLTNQSSPYTPSSELHRAEMHSSRYSRSNDSFPTYTSQSGCLHGGWWPQIDGYMACENCNDWHGYLLQCPDCEIRTCASCQKVLRPPKRNVEWMRRSRE